MGCSHFRITGSDASRVPANIDDYDLSSYHSIISEEKNSNLNFNISQVQSTLKRRRQQRAEFSCVEDLDVALALALGEHYLSIEDIGSVNEEELIDLTDYFEELVTPLTLYEATHPVSGLTDKVSRRINNQLLYRKDSVLMLSLLIYKYQKRFGALFDKYEKALRNVATFDSITIIRRIAQSAVSSLMPSTNDKFDNLLISNNFLEGEVVLNGTCEKGISYEFLKADSKGGELIANFEVPKNELNFESFLLQVCKGTEFKLCNKKFSSEERELTKSEYENFIIKTKAELIAKVQEKFSDASNGSYQANDLEKILDKNIELLKELIVKFELKNGFQGSEEDKQALSVSHIEYRELNSKLELNLEKKKEYRQNRAELVFEYLNNLKNKIVADSWFKTPVGDFKNGVTSSLAYKNQELVRSLNTLTQRPDFWSLMVSYAKKDLLGENLSKRVLATAR